MDLPGADVPPPPAVPLGCGALPADQLPWVAETWALLRRFQGAVGVPTLPSLHQLEVRGKECEECSSIFLPGDVVKVYCTLGQCTLSTRRLQWQTRRLRSRH